MSASLLHLDDHLIKDIAFYLHQDNFIPLPSFHPHWSNLTSEIGFIVQKDFMNFRSTCRRIRDLCKLKGLHIRLQRWERLLEWKSDAPDTVRSAVRRLEIDILDVEIDEVIGENLLFIQALISFTNLEELIITKFPCCAPTFFADHIDARDPPQELLYNSLRKVRSYANMATCCFCYKHEIEKVLVPLMPDIQYLKLNDTKHAHETFVIWSSRHTGLITPIDTFFCKWDECAGHILLSSDVHLDFLSSNIRVLIIQPDERFVPVVPPLQFRARQRHDILKHWSLEFYSEFELHGDEVWDLSQFTDHDMSQGAWKYMENWLQFLESLGHLEVLDCMFTLTTDQRRPQLYDGTRRGSDRFETERQVKEYELNLRSAIVFAAQRNLDYIPNLQVGFFWEPYKISVDNRLVQEWYRWEWHQIKDRDGASHIKVCQLPELIKPNLSKDRIICEGI